MQHLSAVERRKPPPDGQAVAGLGPGQPEGDAPPERPHEGGVATALGAETEAAGRLSQIEREAVGLGLEAEGQSTEQPGCGGPEDGEPVRLDVGGARVVA